MLADFPDDIAQAWTNSLVAMRYDNPEWRDLMDLEGLKRWLPADPTIMKGYDVLFEAVEKQGLLSGSPFPPREGG